MDERVAEERVGDNISWTLGKHPGVHYIFHNCRNAECFHKIFLDTNLPIVNPYAETDNLSCIQRDPWPPCTTFYPMEVTEETFANLLRGKRIVILGGAPLQGWGNVIDSFDLVVRVNRGHIASYNAPENQGSRTDILYSSCHSHETHQVNSAPIDLDFLHRICLKALCFHNTPPRKIKDDIISNTRVPWKLIDEDLITHLKNIELAGTKPHSGTIAIKDLLQYEIKELYVMGFTFFQGNQLYSRDFKTWDNQTAISEANRLHGGFQRELEWFRNSVESDNRIKIDQNLYTTLRRSPRLLKDEDFASLVTGKTVALVGPAKYLVGSRLGDTIDSFDLVVRMNLGIIDSEELKKDIGRRVDILYTAMSVETGTAPIEMETWERLGLKAVVIKNTYSHKTYKNKFEKENTKIPYRFVSDPFTEYLHHEIGTKNLHTGIIAIYDLLRFGVSELFLTGFTFFQGKGSYMKEYKQWEDSYAKERAMMANHNYEKEFQYFLRTLESQHQIYGDPHLAKIIRDNNADDSLISWTERVK